MFESVRLRLAGVLQQLTCLLSVQCSDFFSFWSFV